MRSESTDSGNPGGEIIASVSLMDFFGVWYRCKGWYILGLFLVALTAFIDTKFWSAEYFEASGRFYIQNEFVAYSLIGAAEIEVFEDTRNKQYDSARSGYLAEEYLMSGELILEAVDQLGRQQNKPCDVYQLLGIGKGRDDQDRETRLVDVIRNGLMQVRHIRNSGIIELNMELTDPRAAADFVNACLGVLKDRFDRDRFGYVDKALEVYRARLKEEEINRAGKAGKLGEIIYDRYPEVDQKRRALEWELEVQAETIALLNKSISMFEMYTDKLARDAGQPVRIIDVARPPTHKNRPRVVLNVLVVATIYTFVFMIGLMVAGFLMNRTERKA